MRIQIPNSWRPRGYQLPAWQYFEGGGKRGVAVWHRRAGKDSLALNLAAAQSHKRVGVYWHMLPTAKQGRKVIWDGIDRFGRRMIDQAFPKEIRSGVNSTEMKIELRCGSIWQVVGSDNYDSLVGANPVGIIFSEYSIANPAAWNYIRPILAENDGWALFIYTSRGQNHGAELYRMALDNPGWFAEKLTVSDTKAIPLSVIDDERATGMDEDLIQQEYFCSFESPVSGSYYGKQLKKAEDEERITAVPYEEKLPVHTAWDIGVGDATAIWFFQLSGKEIRIIDYYETSGEGLPYYIKYLKEKPYIYGNHWAPHDIEVREFSSGKSRKETAKSLGIDFKTAKNLPVDDGIDVVRSTLSRCWFDKDKCKQGLNALKNYRKEYDEKRKEFKQAPYHDWASHGADAFRYLSLCVDELTTYKYPKVEEPRSWMS